MPQHELTVERLTKVFQTSTGAVAAVADVNFSIANDDFFTLLGPSGCGKTTTLRMIAGLETATSGRILFDGEDFTTYSAFQRGIGMVFQSYALFPHMTVFENGAYGLRVRRQPEADIKRQVTRVLDMLGLAELSGRYPSDLSGGQQQRVSIARALVYEPSMLLLDEPLANLDAKLRVQMREEIRRIQKSLGIMTLYVTHDQEEAMSVSDRIGVFDRGKLLQFGAPRDIYTNPRSLFVADFVGRANFFRVDVLSDDGRFGFSDLGEASASRHHRLVDDEAAKLASRAGLLLVRPEHLQLSSAGPGVQGRVKRVQFLGGITRYVLECGQAISDVVVESARPADGVGEGVSVWLNFAPSDAILFSR